MVTIKKATVVSLLDSNGKEFFPGDTMLIESDSKCFVGVYKGIAKRGALIFTGIRDFADCEFHIMPNSIDGIIPFEE